MIRGRVGGWCVWGLVSVVVGACSSGVVRDDPDASYGGEGGTGPRPTPGSAGEAASSDCENYLDVVCSWQRAYLGSKSDFRSRFGGQTPCKAAEPLFDPTDVPQGGAGGDDAYGDACASYVPVPDHFDPPNQRYGHWSEEERGECNIFGHCCVLIETIDCTP